VNFFRFSQETNMARTFTKEEFQIALDRALAQMLIQPVTTQCVAQVHFLAATNIKELFSNIHNVALVRTSTCKIRRSA
jgi:Leu/Phe-tRNA-protein transferase